MRLTVAWIAATLTLASARAPGTRVQSPGAAPLDGSWVSVGYGIVARVHGNALQTYEITGVSCLASMSAHRHQASDPKTFNIDGGNDVVLLVPDTVSGQARLHEPGAASDIVLQRVDAIPARCRHAMPHDPMIVFDVFWQTYHDQYPFFALHHRDWDSVRASLRPRAAHASPMELFGLLRSAIEPLSDAHTFIAARSIRQEYQGFRGGVWPDAAARAQLAGIVEARLTTPLRTWARGAIAFAMLPDSIAYLRVTRFEGYTTDGVYEHDRLTLDSALDSIFADTHAWRGLAIDVRVNSGGDDPLGLEIASRLATAPYLAYTKVARSNPDDPVAMTPGQPSMVRPSDRPGWRGAVVELTSRYTVSAGETFTQAMMGRRPAIERVGENTQGVFSDVLERKLPNGWSFGLPNEVYLTPKDSSFDVTGIPPTVAIPTFTQADVAARRDPGLDRAMALLLGAT